MVCGNLLTAGAPSKEREEEIMKRVHDGGFGHKPQPEIAKGSPFTLDRESYADFFGPTRDDRVVLGDTSLVARVEKDYTTYGDECKFGGGKTLREGMGQATGLHAERYRYGYYQRTHR